MDFALTPDQIAFKESIEQFAIDVAEWERENGPLTEAEGAWEAIGPSAIAFNEGYPVPREMTTEEVRGVVEEFAQGARNAVAAGFRAIEVHEAHGYLVAEFLSPFTNQRTDEYGGDFEGRIRFAVEIAQAVRAAIGDSVDLMVDYNQALTVQEAIRRGRDLLDLDIYWLEEQILHRDLRGYAAIAAELPAPHVAIMQRIREGFTQEEIAALVGVNVRTIQRIVERVRELCEEAQGL